MNCDEWRLFLQDYVDGVLSEPARRAIDRHLSDCAGCFADARTHRQIVEGLARESIPSPGLADRIMARIPHPALGWKRELIRLAAAAALVVGLGLGALAVAPRGPVAHAKSIVESELKVQESQLQVWMKKAGF